MTKSGTPECNILTFFPITDDHISSFRRYSQYPKDCFINAFQIFGYLDNACANIMRITCIGTSGVTQEQINKICILLSGSENRIFFNFDFKKYNLSEFEEKINSIPPRYSVLAGFTDPDKSHTFIIARNLKNELILIDPQIGPQLKLYTYEYAKTHNLNIQQYNENRKYVLLHQSEQRLTNEQLRDLGFIL